MTQTSPEASERVSSRQRRIEEQRRKIDSVRREQRRRRLIWGGLVVAVLALAVVLLVLFFPRPVPDMMRQVSAETGTHVDPGTPLSYHSRPPSSGPHYAALPQPTDYRMYDQSISPGLWVHMLEHGSIVVLYRPDLCDQACMSTLTDVYDSAPRDSSFNLKKLAVLPYTSMDHAVAVVAWGYVDEMDATQVDKSRMLADYRARIDKGPETAI